MRRVLGVLLVGALIVGIVIQETYGRVKRLPAVLQPFARRVQAAVAPAATRMEAALAPLKKLSVGNAPAETPKNQAQGSARPAAPKLEVMEVTYEESEDLLAQFRTNPPANPSRCGTYRPRSGRSTPSTSAGCCRRSRKPISKISIGSSSNSERRSRPSSTASTRGKGRGPPLPLRGARAAPATKRKRRPR